MILQLDSRLDPRFSVDPYIFLSFPPKYTTQEYPEHHLKMTAEPGTVVCACNASTLEAGIGRQGLVKPGLHSIHCLKSR